MALNLQYLRHGKALCGKVFANFVETFNHLVNFSVNLSGDNDTAGGSGHITVDRADPSHPIIRCSGCGKSNGGGGGGGAGQGGGDGGQDGGGSTGGYNPGGTEGSAGSIVNSLNALSGSVKIIGGDGIKVSVRGNSIVISYSAGKKPDPVQEEPTDPCDHPGDGHGEGVLVDEKVPDHDFGGGVPSDGGGVAAGGDSHAGEPCPDCSPAK